MHAHCFFHALIWNYKGCARQHAIEERAPNTVLFSMVVWLASGAELKWSACLKRLLSPKEVLTTHLKMLVIYRKIYFKCISKFLYLSGFCYFGLVLFMVLWQCPNTPVMSCFHMSVRLGACSSRALSCLRALFHVWAWSSDPNTYVLSFSFVSGFVIHGWWFVCWPCVCVIVLWVHGFCLSFLCAMCSHVNLSWPHPSCYLIIDLCALSVPRYPPQLLPLISPCFCNPGWFVVVFCVCLVSCPALPCLALSSQTVFPLRGSFFCFVYIIINKKKFCLLHLSPHPHSFSIPDSI